MGGTAVVNIARAATFVPGTEFPLGYEVPCEVYEEAKKGPGALGEALIEVAEPTGRFTDVIAIDLDRSIGGGE
jgi:hypothetical protein